MNLPTVFIRITLAVTLAVVAVGCRKKQPTLTPIPENSTVGNGYGSGPAGNMMTGNSGSGMGTGNPYNNNNFAQGSDFTGDNGGGGEDYSLPNNPDDFSNKTETPLDSSTVYFDFDRYQVNASELPKIISVANTLKETPGSRLRIEGHCDERGTEEYNRTLGERRALSVRDVLVKEGIASSRITTESWGEDKPVAEGKTESAYSKNRRGEFILLQ